MVRTTLVMVVFAAACASTPEPQKQAFPTDVARGPAVTETASALHTDEDPKAVAERYMLPGDCEKAAHKYQSVSRDYAWKVLRACVEKGKFTSIRLLLGEHWEKDLQTRSDAAATVAKVIAMRGGDVGGDLKMLRSRKVPVFTLGAAMAQPDTYKGRLVIVRAKVIDARAQGGKPTVKLAEMQIGATTEEVQVGKAWTSKHKSGSSGSGQVEVSTSNYGDASAKGSYEERRQSESKWTETEERHDNVASETGRVALVRLKEPDPFLEPGKTFIMLARFDGLRTTSASADEDDQTISVLSILHYQEPNPLLVE